MKSKSRLQIAAFEALENRQMMSGSAAVVNGILTIAGDPTLASNITVGLSGSTISATNGHGASVSAALASVKGIEITGGTGNDYVYVDSGITVPETISGGAGNDQIHGGGGTNTITEGDGNDYVDARGPQNSITAGNGNDTLSGSVGADTVIAGSGNDSVYTSNENDSITVGGGNDTVTANGGNDTIVAGNGKDSLDGGVGNDQITVGTGLSTLIPGLGTNYVQSANKADTIVAAAGSTTVAYVAAAPATSTGGTTTTTGTGTSSTGTGTGTGTSTGSTGTTTTSGGGSTGGSTTTTTSTPTNAQSPKPVIDVVSTVSTAGIAVVVNGLSSALGSGSAIDANYQWNFGDPNGEYNTLAGFNASHVYTTAGTYKISLTVTNDLNEVSTVSKDVVISADDRKAIYVDSVHGSDSNSGLSASSPLKTAAAADAKVGDNTEVFFARGETFNLSAAFKLDDTNVLVGAYGSGAQPIINYTAPALGSVIFTTNSSAADGVTVQDLTFTTLDGTEPTVANQPMAVMAGGYDTAVLRCTFDYVEYDVNGSSSPVGLTVFDNTSPISGGLEGYFVWDQGTDTAIVGNTVNGSDKEHIVRTSGASDILVADNTFANYDGKGCIEIHVGDHAWVDSNTVTSGDIRVGPLGLWGEPVDATSDCVIQNNHVIDSDIAVYPGAQSISIRNNIINNAGTSIDVMGQDGLGRQSSDIRILNNTGINSGTEGQFLKVESHVDGILLENNLYSEPDLAVGGYNAAPVFVAEANLSSFTYINDNVWQLPKTFYSSADGGVNYLDGAYVTTSVWNAESEVGTDFFYNVAIDSSGAPAVGSAAATAGSAIEGVFGDIDGKARPASGSWSAGAVQV